MRQLKPHLPEKSHPSDRASELTQKIRAAHAINRAKHMTDLDQRLADMENMKLDVMAISCAPQQFYYIVEPSLGAESCRLINDGIAEAVKAHPSRFTGIGTVPLQDTELAIKEATKATIRLLPLDDQSPAPEDGKCIKTGAPSKQRVLFAKNY